jgi:aspartyl-tRNA(Asn)/glutamyl-tRNA(Gln) amidotransferase subunit B
MTDAYRIKGETGEWEVVVGLEVHAQVVSNAKLFSGAATAFGAEPNTQVSLVDAAMPGMLPVPNRECIRQAVRTGMALDARINRWSRFDRKNYFYADLPQGYQISQLYHPLVGEGVVDILLDEKDESSTKPIGIERIHVEQDAGKLMHDQHPTMSYVDLNRCGVALMEIVSRPDMRSPAEAGAYLRKLRSILRYVGSCDGNMEEGSMRADVNVSVRKAGSGELGTRTETKNVNSVRFVMATIEHEAKRQVQVLEEGGEIVQETRLFDPDKGVTRPLRSKEDAHDYRYFPDPDLLPLELDDAFLEECKASLPELPDNKRKRYEGLGITPYNASVLTAEVETARWFDSLLEAGAEPKQAANWVVAELFGALNRRGEAIDQSPVSPVEAAELLRLVADGTISGTIAKQVFEIMLETGEAPGRIVEARGLKQTSDTGAIDAAIDKILADNADKVAEYKSGKQQLFGFFVGQTMKAMAGKANPQVVNERLRAKLG